MQLEKWAVADLLTGVHMVGAVGAIVGPSVSLESCKSHL